MQYKKEYYIPEYKYESYKDLESDLKIPMKPLHSDPYIMDKNIQNPILKKKQMKTNSAFKKYTFILFVLLFIYTVFRLLLLIYTVFRLLNDNTV